MYNNRHVIHERSNIIPISKNLSTEQLSPKGEYSLKQSIFDPSKNSPPNSFMIKLYLRNKIYNFNQIKEDSFEIQ